MDTVKATNRFTDYCQSVYDSENDREFIIATRLAQTYSKAIKDICGGQVWLEVVSFVEDVIGVENVCGIPTSYKHQKQLQDA